jgi:hypothetical protein
VRFAILSWSPRLPTRLPKPKGKGKLSAGIAALWTVLVMNSRVSMGVYFATDRFTSVPSHLKYSH